MEACNAGPDNDCPFTDGRRRLRRLLLARLRATWTQPTYTGLSARGCLGVRRPATRAARPTTGPIGTLPNYAEHGLVSDGDPAVAFGPQPTAGGGFSYANGSRLYYANLTSAIPGTAPFKGAEAIAVSHTDDVAAAATGSNAAWSDPVIASRQTSALFSDKEQVWADNAASSPFFGNVYVCYAAFRGNGNGFTNQPLDVLTSRDGGDTWSQQQVTPATNNTKQPQRLRPLGLHRAHGLARRRLRVRLPVRLQPDDGRRRPDPDDPVLRRRRALGAPGEHLHRLRHLQRLRAVDRPLRRGRRRRRAQRPLARSVGRHRQRRPERRRTPPTGSCSRWVDGRDGLNNEHVMFTTSTSGGDTWTPPRRSSAAATAATTRRRRSRPTAPTSGSSTTRSPSRSRPARSARQRPAAGRPGPARDGGRRRRGRLHARAPRASGDARGSSQNDLAAEFLGDYVYAAATRRYGVSVWNDVRDAADCGPIDQYRQDLHDEAVATGQPTAEARSPAARARRARTRMAPVAPAVQQVCPATFGNSDIFGWSSLATP